jgi:hypothetical protein
MWTGSEDLEVSERPRLDMITTSYLNRMATYEEMGCAWNKLKPNEIVPSQQFE